MKKIILLVGLAICLTFVITIVVLYLNERLDESYEKSLVRAAKKAEDLCAVMKERNKEMKIMAGATLFLEKKGLARYQEIKNLEALLKKLEESEKLISESKSLLNGICQDEETAIEKFRQFGRNVKKVIKIQWEALRTVEKILSSIEIRGKGETPT